MSKLQCPKCQNTGDIILLIESLCWCPCGHHWVLDREDYRVPEIVAAFTCHGGSNVVIRLTSGSYNGKDIS